MSIKEKPLIDAVSRLGPLPGFLFENAVFTGFFAMFMCAVFFGVFVAFEAAGHGASDAVELFDLVRWGAIFGLIFGAVIFWGIAISAFFHPEEKTYRLQFFFGGVLAIALFVIADRLALEAVRDWLTPMGRII